MFPEHLPFCSSTISSIQEAEEERYIAMGQTDTGKTLFVVFTPRGKMVRAISARPMDRKERKFYEESAEENSVLNPRMKKPSFGSSHSSTDYVDWSAAKRLRSPLVKRTANITLPLTLPKSTYNRLRELASDRDVPYTLLCPTSLSRWIEERNEGLDSRGVGASSPILPLASCESRSIFGPRYQPCKRCKPGE